MSDSIFYQCAYCKIFFNHKGEERKEQPANFAGDHGACEKCRDTWKADLRKRMLNETKAVFTN